MMRPKGDNIVLAQHRDLLPAHHLTDATAHRESGCHDPVSVPVVLRGTQGRGWKYIPITAPVNSVSMSNGSRKAGRHCWRAGRRHAACLGKPACLAGERRYFGSVVNQSFSHMQGQGIFGDCARCGLRFVNPQACVCGLSRPMAQCAVV